MRTTTRFARRTVVAVLITLVTGAVLATLIVGQRADLVLGDAIVHADQSSLPANPDLAGASSALDLSSGDLRSIELPPKTVVLTFDDGPDPRWTPQIQKVLDSRGVRATFFVVGEQVMRYPGVVRDLSANGHEIASHTFTHARLGDLDDWQIELQIALTQRAVIGAIGKHPTAFRPPYSGNPEYLQPSELAAARVAASAGLSLVLTDRVVPDYNPEITVAELVSGAMPRDGASAVLTFHDAGGDREKTVEAVDQLVQRLDAAGYEFALVSDVTGNGPVAATMTESFVARALLHGTRTAMSMAKVLFFVGVAYTVLAVVRAVLLFGFAHRNQRRRARAAHHTRRAGDRFSAPVSVIVPAFNEAVGIAESVRSLSSSDYPQLEVIVVDDGSTDGTADVVEALALPNVRVIRQPNGGKPSALNTGLAAAKYDIVVMVDGDTIFESSTVDRLVQPFVDPDVGAVAGNPRVGNRRRLITTMQHLEYCIGSSLERRMFDEVGAMLCIPGAIGAFRRRAVESVGGVSADTLAEDTDLTMALTRAGWRVAYAPDARAYTEAPATVRALYRQRFRWTYGILQSITKHRRSVLATGRAGVLGRFVIPYTLLLGYVTALAAPAIDLVTVYALATGSMQREVLVLAALVNGLAIATALYALRIDRAPLRHAVLLPLQVVVYRQVLYLVTLRSIWTAVLGVRLPWQSNTRQGALRIERIEPARAVSLLDDTVVDLRDTIDLTATKETAS